MQNPRTFIKAGIEKFETRSTTIEDGRDAGAKSFCGEIEAFRSSPCGNCRQHDMACGVEPSDPSPKIDRAESESPLFDESSCAPQCGCSLEQHDSTGKAEAVEKGRAQTARQY